MYEKSHKKEAFLFGKLLLKNHASTKFFALSNSACISAESLGVTSDTVNITIQEIMNEGKNL